MEYSVWATAWMPVDAHVLTALHIHGAKGLNLHLNNVCVGDVFTENLDWNHIFKSVGCSICVTIKYEVKFWHRIFFDSIDWLIDWLENDPERKTYFVRDYAAHHTQLK